MLPLRLYEMDVLPVNSVFPDALPSSRHSQLDDADSFFAVQVLGGHAADVHGQDAKEREATQDIQCLDAIGL
jgi:hypothetical protein